MQVSGDALENWLFRLEINKVDVKHEAPKERRGWDLNPRTPCGIGASVPYVEFQKTIGFRKPVVFRSESNNLHLMSQARRSMSSIVPLVAVVL